MSSPEKQDHHFSHYTFGINWLDPFSPTFSPRSKPSSEVPRKGSRRLYFGSPSLVPPSFSPPHPIVWDGSLPSGEKINATELNNRIVNSLEQLGEYRKPMWYSSMVASAAPIMYEHDLVFKREELLDSDEGTITIDWAFPPDPPAGGPPAPAPTDVPTVVIFPGLAGHSGKDYIRSIAARVTRFLHARVCILNWRGFNCKLTSHKVFRADDISDMETTIAHAAGEYPGSKVFAIGFSAGSNQLVKYLGRHGGKHPVSAAVSVCNGFEYEPHIKRIEGSPLGEALYSRGMTFLHQEYLRVHGEKLAERVEGFDLQTALAASKHTELDEVLVKTLYGYDDIKEYYANVSSRPHIPTVAVPLLCIQSADDPLFTEGDVRCYQVLPVEDLYRNPYVVYFETEFGAHLSFVESSTPLGMMREEYTFADRAAEAFLRAVDPAAWPKPTPA